MSEQLGVLNVDMLVDREPIYCLNDVISVDDTLLQSISDPCGTLQVSDTGSKLSAGVL